MDNKLNLYYNESGTHMVDRDPVDGTFIIDLGPNTGMNGDSGCVYTQSYYVYNDGDTIARYATLREVGDSSDLFKISVNDSKDYKDKLVSLGDIPPRGYVKISLHSIIPPGTTTLSGTINYEIYSYKLPDEEVTLEFTDPTETEEKETPNLTTHVDAVDSHGGKPYGDGAYGKPFLYGQEGFIHITKQINAIAVIAGMDYSYIDGNYIIRSHYNGTEKNIEDIQSYYSRNYYDLDAYDGPILPLFLDDIDEGNTEIIL